uniref:Secreted protein n=1 Tax=Macrostomum lignano TaxID=282301 RepID=A0A1I8G0L5_9PLAT
MTAGSSVQKSALVHGIYLWELKLKCRGFFPMRKCLPWILAVQWQPCAYWMRFLLPWEPARVEDALIFNYENRVVERCCPAQLFDSCSNHLRTAIMPRLARWFLLVFLLLNCWWSASYGCRSPWHRLETQSCLSGSLALWTRPSGSVLDCVLEAERSSGLQLAQFDSDTRQCSLFQYT